LDDERRCAICGYDTKVGQWDLALDAAHIQWHQAAGPSILQNGLALENAGKKMALNFLQIFAG
jgi:predicted restriction endonuclease